MFFINNRNSKNNLQNSNQELSNLQTSNQETETNNIDNAVANYQHVTADTTVGDYYGSYRAMCEAQKEGKIKSIGISNFRPDRLVDLCMNQELKPAVNQIEINPFDQNYEEERVMREYGVQPEAWAPFAEGKNDIFHNEILTEIGKKYNKSVAQVILRWLVQRGIVVLTKSTDINRIKENFDIFNFELSKEDMEKIKEINTGSSQFFNHYDLETVKMLNNLHRN